MGRLAPTDDKPRCDKLGVKPGMRVAVIGVDDEPFIGELMERTDDITIGDVPSATDLVFFAADSHEQLADLPAMRRRINPDGAIWVVSRKGREATIRDVDVIEAALAAELVDNKVVSFSPTHTSLRLVIRLEDRERHRLSLEEPLAEAVDTTGGGT